MISRLKLVAGSMVMVVVSGLACQKAKNDVSPTGSAAASAAPAARGSAAPYQGPTGSVEGVITMQGDEPPTLPEQSVKIPSTCPDAAAMFSRLFREGAGRTVADVFVAVTGYKGNVTSSAPAQMVEGRGCAWDRRTIGVYAAQRIDVRSGDELAYIPELLGATTKSMLVATPKAAAVPVFTRGVGHYVLLDGMRIFNKADVLVVRYPTFQVTGLDGKFHIANLPVGKAKISAFLPSANLTVEADVVIAEDASVRVPLTLRFDQSVYDAASPKGSTPSSSSARPASAKPPASAGVGTAPPRPSR